MEMQPHQERVVKEAKELRDKLVKLRNFFNTETFKLLSDFEKSLLHRQHAAMYEYLQVLEQRIGHFVVWQL